MYNSFSLEDVKPLIVNGIVMYAELTCAGTVLIESPLKIKLYDTGVLVQLPTIGVK